MRLKFFVGALLLAILMVAAPGTLHAQVAIGVTVGFAPPEIPVYEQPICPGDGYIWTPGYWDYDSDAADYFWVPGTWILAPEVGYLWTPPWWGWGGSGFILTAGYWGPVVGFYGGINYGFGYFGTGFYGGRWDHDHFYYNTAVWHVGGDFHNVYNERVDIHNDVRVSYNGHGGIDARPTPQEEAAAHGRHIGPVAAQNQHIQAARSNQELRASVNHGAPPVAATAKPGAFTGGGVERASNNGSYKAPAGGNRPAEAGSNARTEGNSTKYTHPNDLPNERPTAPKTGDAKTDKQYQQQQDKLYQQQQKDRQKLQAQQDKEHQQAQKQQADAAKNQQMEERHAQQTQQLQQKHTQQMQQMQQRQSAPPASHGGGGGKPK
jgi:hypothetical protein